MSEMNNNPGAFSGEQKAPSNEDLVKNILPEPEGDEYIKIAYGIANEKEKGYKPIDYIDEDEDNKSSEHYGYQPIDYEDIDPVSEGYAQPVPEEKLSDTSAVGKTEDELQGERMQAFIDRLQEEQSSSNSNTQKTEDELQGERMQTFIDRLQEEQGIENTNKQQSEDKQQQGQDNENPTTKLEEAESNEAEDEAKKTPLYAVDAKEINEDVARYYADKEITKEQNKIREKGIRGIFGRMYWRVFEEYERQKAINKYREQINSGSLDKNEEFQEDRKAAAERLATSADEALHYGENREEANEDFNNSIKDLIKHYVNGEIDENAFEKIKFELLDSAYIKDRKLMFKKEDIVDNLLEVADSIKGSQDHEKALSELDMDFSVILGNVRGNLRAKENLNGFDKFVEGLQQSRFWSSALEPATIGIAAGLIYSAATFTTERLVRSNAAKIGTLGASSLLGFAYGVARKGKEVERDFAMHSREMEAGGEILSGSKGRERMEQFRVEGKSSNSSVTEINEILSKGELSPELRQILTEKVVDIRARIEASDEYDAPYITYSRIFNQRERNALDEAVAKAEEALIENLPEGSNFTNELRNKINNAKAGLLGENTQKIGERDRFKKIEAVKAGFIAATTMGIVGGAVHEFADYIGDSDFTSFFHRTAFSLEGDKTLGVNPDVLNQVSVGRSTTINLPEGLALIKNQEGTLSLTNKMTGELVADHIIFNNDGSLSPSTVEMLHKEGINLITAPVEGSGEVTTYTDIDAISHRPEFERVFRDPRGWYDENTSGIYELNEKELRLGIDANGNFVYDVSHMTSDGSFHDELSADYLEEIKNHNLKLNLSLSEETQRYVASVEFDKNGQAIIPKDSPLAQMFFENHDGQVVFKGRFAEVAQVIGGRKGEDGQIHDLVRMLATAEGKGVDTVTVTNPEAFDYTLEMPRDSEFYVPIMPFRRNPLENVGKKEEPVPPVTPTPTPEGPSGESPEPVGTGEGTGPNVEKEETSETDKIITSESNWVNNNISKEEILGKSGEFAEFLKTTGLKDDDYSVTPEGVFTLINVEPILALRERNTNKNSEDIKVSWEKEKPSEDGSSEQSSTPSGQQAAETNTGAGTGKSPEKLNPENPKIFRHNTDLLLNNYLVSLSKKENSTEDAISKEFLSLLGKLKLEEAEDYVYIYDEGNRYFELLKADKLINNAESRKILVDLEKEIK